MSAPVEGLGRRIRERRLALGFSGAADWLLGLDTVTARLQERATAGDRLVAWARARPPMGGEDA